MQPLHNRRTWVASVLAAAVIGLVSPPSYALTDAEIVASLEAIGNLAAAYPLAVNVAAADGSYKAWRDAAAKYARFDKNGAGYLGAWQAARRLNSEPAYVDFMTLRPQSPLNGLAVNAAFVLKQELDTIRGYQDFINRFPNSVEAVQALLRIHEIAFDRARRENTVEVYDAFIRAFPLATQAVEANRSAERLERTAIDRDVGTTADLSNGDKRDRVARRLFNDAREAEKAGRPEIAGRNYALLAEPRFRDTKAYTEWLDRQERLDFQKVLLDQQARIKDSIDGMGRAVVAGLGEVRAEVRAGADTLRAAIDSHNREVRRAMAAQGEELRRYADAGATNMGQALSGQISGLAYSMQAQTVAMEQASREAGWRQDRLFQQSQEQAAERAKLGRRCAEILTREGKYGWFSGCD